MNEIDEKVERVARLAHDHKLDAVLLSKQSNFAWLSGGQTNRIDGSSETGAGSLLVTATGRRYLVANTIEMPRLRDEALRQLDFEPVEYPWAADHANPAVAVKLAQQVVAGRLGTDIAAQSTTDLSSLLPAIQTPLTDAELTRYRALGQDAAEALESTCRRLASGMSETEVAAMVAGAMATIDARPIVLLAAADDRVAAYRHPVPTTREWAHTMLVGVCAERHGLVVALSRMVSRRAEELRDVTAATAQVYAALLAATQPGLTGAQLFTAATNAYRNVGHEGQERLHHQGGAIGYRSRDWIAHPASNDVVHERQAFAWNPSITGTKVEDTVLLVDGRLEPITKTAEWPAIDVAVGDTYVRASGILEAQ